MHAKCSTSSGAQQTKRLQRHLENIAKYGILTSTAETLWSSPAPRHARCTLDTPASPDPSTLSSLPFVILLVIGFFFFFLTFIEPHGATHGELNQPSPQCQVDRPQSVKVYGHIEGHYNNLMLMLILLKVTISEVLTVVEGLVTILG